MGMHNPVFKHEDSIKKQGFTPIAFGKSKGRVSTMTNQGYCFRHRDTISITTEEELESYIAGRRARGTGEASLAMLEAFYRSKLGL